VGLLLPHTPFSIYLGAEVNRESRREADKRKTRLVELAQGVYVERDVLGIVQRIMDRWPNLTVKYLDPDQASDITDTPYRIVELSPDGFERVVFGCWTLDETVIQKLEASDTHSIDIMAAVDKANAKVRADQAKAWEDRKAVENELVTSVLNSPKDTYKATHPVTGKELEFRSIPKSED
jgi:hypothetical protein